MMGILRQDGRFEKEIGLEATYDTIYVTYCTLGKLKVKHHDYK